MYIKSSKKDTGKKDALAKLENFKARLRNNSGENATKSWMQSRLHFTVDSITAFKTDENKSRVID